MPKDNGKIASKFWWKMTFNLEFNTQMNCLVLGQIKDMCRSIRTQQVYFSHILFLGSYLKTCCIKQGSNQDRGKHGIFVSLSLSLVCSFINDFVYFGCVFSFVRFRYQDYVSSVKWTKCSMFLLSESVCTGNNLFPQGSPKRIKQNKSTHLDL